MDNERQVLAAFYAYDQGDVTLYSGALDSMVEWFAFRQEIRNIWKHRTLGPEAFALIEEIRDLMPAERG